MNKPQGYHSITPYFTVVDADMFIEFTLDVFGGVVIRINRNSSGRVQHARIQIGDSVIMLNEESEDYQSNASQMHLYVEDVDTTYAKALSAGATTTMEPNIRPHGDKMAGLKDPCGNSWWIAQYAGD